MEIGSVENSMVPENTYPVEPVEIFNIGSLIVYYSPGSSFDVILTCGLMV